ncbi:MAG: CRISPR-associated protein Cas4 [Clostridiaceae bacterium]|nr:CRISPR-associated protein Cas4 [Clostridiales bacterium]MDD6876371.1 CRISPR-associated protein Cas4 [Clostridiaceae bacterium]MDY3285037.1 CRISPR-associated protein Cas4 [Eubacteriales bacterium]
MIYPEEEYLQLSGLQHFAFCRRQWALIHIENLWAENFRTVDGALMHEKAHDCGSGESRGDLLIRRGVSIHSASLGISGQCDVLEFRRDSAGIPLPGHEGLWQPYPVEYKRGAPKDHDADALQLCAQAMCLEEMLCCAIPEGALFYGETRRRERVSVTEELRGRVKEQLVQMHELFRRGHTPKARPTRACGSCSIKELCLPRLSRQRSVSAYLKDAMEDMP